MKRWMWIIGFVLGIALIILGYMPFILGAEPIEFFCSFWLIAAPGSFLAGLSLRGILRKD